MYKYSFFLFQDSLNLKEMFNLLSAATVSFLLFIWLTEFIDLKYGLIKYHLGQIDRLHLLLQIYLGIDLR